MYEYIDHILANYFSSSAANSEQEAILVLREHMAISAELEHSLRTEIENALHDSNYSWKNSLANYDVFFTENEEDARSYAKRLLWDAVFVDK